MSSISKDASSNRENLLSSLIFFFWKPFYIGFKLFKVYYEIKRILEILTYFFPRQLL